MQNGGRRLAGFRFVALLGWIVLNLTGTWSLLDRGDVHDDSDSAYYFQRGRELAEGRWATESLIVSHLVKYEEVTHPSFDHWQPMVAIVSGAAGWLLGDPELGARLALFLFGSLLLPGLVYLFIVGAGGTSAAGLFAVALYLSIASLDHFRLVLDTVSFAGVFLLAGCLCGARAVSRLRPPASFCVLTGLAFGFAAMTRGDAVPVSLLMCGVVSGLAPKGERARVLGLTILALALTYSPLLVKNLVQFGGPMPPGMARVPSLVHFCDWYSFHQETTFRPFQLEGWLQPRTLALRLATVALLRSPLVLFSLAIVVISFVMRARGNSRLLAQRARFTSSLVLAVGCYVAFNVVGVVLAPALTLWFHRSPLPYWPILISGGVLGADHLIRLLPDGAWRYAAVIAGLGLVSPSIALNPVRHLYDVPNQIAPEYRAAASAVPAGAVVATNAPLPLYVYYRGGVVRLPNDGKSAVADLIRHYDVEYLVLFPIEYDCDPQQFLYGLFTQSGPHERRLVDGISLVPLVNSERYRVYKVETPP